MAAPVFANPQRRMAPRLSAFAVGVILVIAASVSLVVLTTQRLGATDAGGNAQTFAQGAGYPLHGGLAGPSRVGTIATSSYGLGYPLHGGLAGPSRVSVAERAPYPHGGFAGPSRAGDDR